MRSQLHVRSYVLNPSQCLLRRMDDAGEWHDDPLIMDERYLAVHVKGRGPVVFSACSHAGIINVMHDAAAVAGSKGTLDCTDDRLYDYKCCAAEVHRRRAVSRLTF